MENARKGFCGIRRGVTIDPDTELGCPIFFCSPIFKLG